jgi:general secretion pathway protein I
MWTKRRSNAGFTLLEIMIALAILGTSLIVLLGLRNRSLATASLSNHMTEAALLAHQQLSDAARFPEIGDQEGAFEETPYRFRQEVRPTPFDGIREVAVEVRWMEGGDEETVRLTRYLFR